MEYIHSIFILLICTSIYDGSWATDKEDLDLQRELTVLKNAVKRLQKEKDEFYKMLKKRDDEISTPPLHHPVIKNLDKSAFTATLSADLQVINGDIVVFDTVITDSLGDYDSTFGFFTCRDTGSYMFIVTLVAPVEPGRALSSAQIIRQIGGSETIVGVFPETYNVGLDYTGSHTTQAIVTCQAGALVYIKSYSPSGDPTVWYAGGRRTLFTGYYL